jgi:hypothetical protein
VEGEGGGASFLPQAVTVNATAIIRISLAEESVTNRMEAPVGCSLEGNARVDSLEPALARTCDAV